MTISFGIGQTLGPIVVGAITDRDGKPVVHAECLGSDAGPRGCIGGVSEEAGAEAVGWAKARLRAVPTIVVHGWEWWARFALPTLRVAHNDGENALNSR